MPLLDNNGRVLGKINLFDLFLVLVVVAVAALAYQRLTVDYRVAPPYALETRQVVVNLDLQLPPERAWLCDETLPGLMETDPRSGEARTEVLVCEVRDGVPVVSLTIYAVRDGAGRILFKGSPVLPGRKIQLETEAVILEGVIRRIALEDAP
jgi:hypothetical protein